MHLAPDCPCTVITREQTLYNTVSVFVSVDMSQPATDFGKFVDAEKVSRARVRRRTMLYIFKSEIFELEDD